MPVRLNIFRRPSRPGVLQRAMLRVLPCWVCTPWRRLVQVLCLAAFAWLLWGAGRLAPSRDLAADFQAQASVKPQLLLWADPAVGPATSLASHSPSPALLGAAIVLAGCLIVPRWFCGYACPLGTLIDLNDWLIGRHVRRWKLRVERLRFLRFGVLAGVFIAAAGGVMLLGYLAPIPLLTRGLATWTAGAWLGSVALLAVLAMTLLAPRFWCRVLCPSGALMSLISRFSVLGRRVNAACVSCGKCVEACDFSAIRDDDFQTRRDACTLCEACGAVCPVAAIDFVAPAGRVRPQPTDPTRRGLLAGLAGGAVVLGGGGWLLRTEEANAVVRPPGSVPEDMFFGKCVRCGQCLQVCPTQVLRPAGFAAGLRGLWTPVAATKHSGCDPTCNACGQVCPTEAIRPLPLDEKREARMGRAVVNERTCLPHAGRGDCQLCVEACRLAGYNAIEFRRVGVEIDAEGLPVEESGYLAPVVIAERCVGCGLCESRCQAVNVQGGKLHAAAIQVSPEGADRIASGSYRALHQPQDAPAEPESPADSPADDGGYLPDFLE